MFRMFALWRKTRKTRLGREVFEANDAPIKIDDERIKAFMPEACHAFARSILARHLDVGSNNAEEAEMVALSNPVYDSSRFGFDFTASPRHADVLAITGPVTRQLKIALEKTYQATPHPKIIMAIGDGACYGTPYGTSYAVLGPVDQFIPVDVYIPGDPPTPEDLMAAFLKCKALLLIRDKN